MHNDGGQAGEQALSLAHANGPQTLGMLINGREVKAGDYFPRAEAQSLPVLTLPTASHQADKTYIGIAMDIDAPFRAFNKLGPILHWMQSDLKADSTGKLQPQGEEFIADYIPPAPPPFASAHRYVFLVYEQPPTLQAETHRVAPKGKHYPELKRMWFDADKFVKEAQLGPMVAGNYFTSN